MAQVVLSFEGREIELSRLPNTIESLTTKIRSELHIYDFSVQVGEVRLTTTNDLLIAYLNNKGDQLRFIVEDQIKPMSYVDNSMDSLFSTLTSTPETTPAFNVTRGTISCTDLATVLTEINRNSSVQMSQVAKKFQEVRLKLLQVDEQKYKEVSIEQMQFQASLQIKSAQQTLKRYNLDPEVFERSMHVHQAAVQEIVKTALGEMTSNDEVPESLTKAKFREVLEFSSQFSTEYLNAHPNITRMDFAILKLREADEVFKEFGFAETEITAAFIKYDFNVSTEWDDIKVKLEMLNQRIMRLESGF